MATFTTSIIHESVFGNKRVVTADITAVGSATATGDAYAPSTLGCLLYTSDAADE